LVDIVGNHEGEAGEKFFRHFGIERGEPGPDMLRAVISAYSRIPYENITKIIKKFSANEFERRMRSPMEVVEGYVNHSTGGTCFSLTFCLGSILSDAGFTCYPVMADMKQANIHCALVVHMGKRRYLVDPGYLLGEPVALTGGTARISTPFGSVELRPRGKTCYDLYTVSGGQRKWRYRLKMLPVSKDMFMKYWERSFSLPTMNSIQLTRLSRKGHLYIRNHHLRLNTDHRKVNENIRKNMESRIESEFGISGDITLEAREYLERMKASWKRGS